MIEKFIADVPAKVWEEGRPARLPNWESSFNLAAWVRITGATGKISLLVLHHDDAGEHRTLVDGANVSVDGSSLLSSQIRIRFVGKVKSVKVLLQLENPAMRHQVEELYMQWQESRQQQHKLIASY